MFPFSFKTDSIIARNRVAANEASVIEGYGAGGERSRQCDFGSGTTFAVALTPSCAKTPTTGKNQAGIDIAASGVPHG